MNKPLLFALLSTTYMAPSYERSAERVAINDNRQPAGVFRDGVLKLNLEARVASWYPDADDGPSTLVHAFAEVGKATQIPGPLIRVPAGTTVNLSIRNAVPNTALVVHGLSNDSITIVGDATKQLMFRFDMPGIYYYWGTTSGRRFQNRLHEDSQLTGAIVVDPLTQTARKAPRDRIFLIGMMADTFGSETIRHRKQLLFVVNGRTWPHTERLTYDMGDTIRWHVLNATSDPHPMHLHGTYYRVESLGDGTRDSALVGEQQPFVNTALMPPGKTMTMSWLPEHDGNWLFHCHVPEHFSLRGPIGARLPESHSTHSIENHALQGMGGLVMGVTVRSQQPMAPIPADPNRRRIRLLVRPNSGSSSTVPHYGFSLNERGPEPTLDSSMRAGPPIILERGQPVGITVVNRTDEPTAVHWHGIELESYFDGVSGFSGIQSRLSPVVAPRDSFEARFTPPRSGTFMYHTHIDELRQQPAGLSGMLLVLEPGSAFNPIMDLPMLITSPSDAEDEQKEVLVNGSATPPALNLQVGKKYRLRFGNITTGRPGLQIAILRDTVLSRWTPVAKDGADLPMSQRVLMPARVTLSIGETRDYEVTPVEPGDLRIEMQTSTRRALQSIIVHVR